MSRNLCETSCSWCNGEVILEEAGRPILEEECGAYFREYRSMLVANAHCRECEAKYLAWVDWPGNSYWTNKGDRAFMDLSFRSTFNDEPGLEDQPKYMIEVVRHRVPYDAARDGRWGSYMTHHYLAGENGHRWGCYKCGAWTDAEERPANEGACPVPRQK